MSNKKWIRNCVKLCKNSELYFGKNNIRNFNVEGKSWFGLIIEKTKYKNKKNYNYFVIDNNYMEKKDVFQKENKSEKIKIFSRREKNFSKNRKDNKICKFKIIILERRKQNGKAQVIEKMREWIN